MDLRPLRRHRDLRWLVTARTVSLFGSMITFVALPYQVYRLTGSSLAVGLLGAAEFVPLVALAFVGGALADARDRRQMIQATEGALAVVAAALVINARLAHPRL